MSKDNRTYIHVHDGMPDHPKVEALSDKAFRLLVSTWCWCSRHTTDGHVRAAVWSKRGTPKSRAELIEADLAEALDDGGVLMHDYLDHQRSKSEISEHRERARINGSKGGRPPKPKPIGNPAGLLNGNPAGNPTGNPDGTQKKTQTKPLSVSDTTTAPTVLPTAPPNGLSITQRSKRITDAYAAVERMCKWPAVNGVVIKAIKTEKWSDAEIHDALQRLANEGRPVTVESLRIELDGLPTSRQRRNTTTPDYWKKKLS